MLRRTRLSLLTALLGLSTANAQTTIDVAKISCDQFILQRVATPNQIAIWLSGYYHGKRNNTVIDVEKLKDQPEKVRVYCLYKDKNATVMEAVEKLMSSGK